MRPRRRLTETCLAQPAIQVHLWSREGREQSTDERGECSNRNGIAEHARVKHGTTELGEIGIELGDKAHCSSGEKLRPRIGFTPRTEKKLTDTRAPGVRSASPFPERMDLPLMKKAISEKQWLCERQ